MSGKGGMRPNRGAGVRQEEPLRYEEDELCRVVMAGEAVLRMGGTSARQSQPVDVPVEGLRSRALTG